jgi:UDP-glucose 4-epimerase
MLKFGRALVTGGAGFIGSHIATHLIKEGCNVVVLDDFSTGNLHNLDAVCRSDGLSIIRGDICDYKLVKKVTKDVEVIFHEAAITSVQRSIEEPEATHRVNVNGTLNLLNGAVDSGVEKFVFASSAAVYGSSKTVPTPESGVLAPISQYGLSKLKAEQYCLEFYHKYGLGTTILRYYNVYGPLSSPGEYSGVITKFAQKIMNGEQIVIYGTGRQSRDFVYVEDAVLANVLAASNNKAQGEIFNVGSGRFVSINELARLETLLLCGTAKERPFSYQPARAGDIKRSCADISKINKYLAFESRFSLEEGLTRYLDWFISTLDDVQR